MVILPIVLAQLVRARRQVGEFATRNKIKLSVYAQIGILFIVLLGAIRTSDVFSASSFGQNIGLLIATTIAVFVLHVAMFMVGFRMAGWLSSDRADQIAVGFSGSQKSLMVGLSAGLELGISVIPLMLFHALQLTIDTIIADRLRNRIKH